MSTLDLRTATLDDIVFEGRNKAYGAFILRQLYHRHLARALAIAVSLTLLFVSAPIVISWLFPPVTVASGLIDLPEDKGVVLTEPPVFEPVKPQTNSAAPPPVATPPNTEAAPTVVPNTTNVDPVTQPVAPTVGPLEADVETSGPYTSPTGTGSGNGPGLIETGGGVEATAPPATVMVAAEIMPQFIGGNEALMEYMKKNLHYPSLALRNGVEGRVFISFTVQADGSIADVQVLKGLGYGTDEEASRVVKNMPAWIPGQQNKRNVAVRYTIPITFQYK
jgi:protein TonB